MEKCLTFSPKRRIDVEEALEHPYLEVGVDATGLMKSGYDVMVRPTMIHKMSRLQSLWIRRSLTLITVLHWERKS